MTPDGCPSLNDLGQVAFEETRDDFSSGIFLATGGGFTTIVDDSGPVGFATDPKLNLFGLVAFAAFLDDGESAIMTGRGGPLRTVASSTGEFAFFDGRPALNTSASWRSARRWTRVSPASSSVPGP